MNIAFDAKRAVRNLTGLGNYSRLVIECLAAAYPEDKLTLFSPDMRANPRLDAIRRLPQVSFRLPAKGEHPLGKAPWRSWTISHILKQEKFDIYHGLSNELPLKIQSSGVPSVVTIHDVIYRRLPDCYSPIDRRIYDFKYGRACRNATRIIAISQRTSLDIQELYGIDPSKIDIIYQGCHPSFSAHWSDERIANLRKRYNLPTRFILQVGTVERRKNLMLTMKALPLLPPDIILIAVGRDRLGYRAEIEREARRIGVDHRLRFLEGVPFDDLPGLNHAASVAAYPSRYEGFGLPVIEAIESGTPVVAATGSCLEEAGGAGALYVNPDDASAMAQALDAIISSPALRQRMAADGRSHTARFNDADMTSAIRTSYLQAIETFRSRQ